MSDFDSISKLLVVHAHPDDETIFTGHIIAHALRVNAQVKVVTLTRGQGGHVSNPKLRSLNHNPDEMAYYRSGALKRAVESFEGLHHAFFGVRNYLETNQDSIGFGKILSRDPLYPLTLCGSGVAVVAEELVPVLKKFRPDAIVTLSPGNKNSDHKMAFKAVRKAIKMLKTSRPPKHYVVLEAGLASQLSFGDEYTTRVKKLAMQSYTDFVAVTDSSFDYGAGEIRFSEQEKLHLVS